MKVAVIGGGAIGLLVGAYVGRDHNVHMYVRREEQLHTLKEKGITCTSLKKPTSVHAQFVTKLEPGYDLVIMAVKQHHVSAALSLCEHAQAPVLFLQNGMGHLEKIQAITHSLIGVVDHGALKRDECTVEHLGKGSIQVAPYDREQDYQKLVASINQKDFPIIYRMNYEQVMISKLIINTVINPLTALFEVQNKQIVDNPSIRKLAKAICKEASLAFDLSFEEEWERVLQVAEKTGENESSMLKDIKAGRLTEVEAISGYILRHSKTTLPYHQFIVDAIHAKERRKD